jgi:ubiquinone/menaquinone biosynthesis C-methylase UbiE
LQAKLVSRKGQLRIQEKLSAEVTDGLKESVFTAEQPLLDSPRLLDWGEMNLEPMSKAAQELGFDPRDADRKIWEKSAVLYAVRSLGFLDRKMKGLGIGVGTESLPFFFSRFCEKIVGIDRYESKVWESAGMSVEDAYENPPVPYDRDRLVFLDCDMRSLDFQDEEFDFIWSVSAVEHVDTTDEYVKTFLEMSRVLKPGGVAFITTEWNLVPRNPVYTRGLIVLDKVLYPWLIAHIGNMKPVKKLNPDQPRNIDHVMAVRFRDSLGRTTRPCINVLSGGSFITPVFLVFRRT